MLITPLAFRWIGGVENLRKWVELPSLSPYLPHLPSLMKPFLHRSHLDILPYLPTRNLSILDL